MVVTYKQYCDDSNTLFVNSLVYHLLEPQDVPKGITVKRSRTQNIDDIHLHWQVYINACHYLKYRFQVKHNC